MAELLVHLVSSIWQESTDPNIGNQLAFSGHDLVIWGLEPSFSTTPLRKLIDSVPFGKVRGKPRTNSKHKNHQFVAIAARYSGKIAVISETFATIDDYAGNVARCSAIWLSGESAAYSAQSCS